MVVRVKSEIADPATYQIRVYQEDLDKDRVVYWRKITLGGKQTERYWSYFSPTHRRRPARAGARPVAEGPFRTS